MANQAPPPERVLRNTTGASLSLQHPVAPLPVLHLLPWLLPTITLEMIRLLSHPRRHHCPCRNHLAVLTLILARIPPLRYLVMTLTQGTKTNTVCLLFPFNIGLSSSCLVFFLLLLATTTVQSKHGAGVLLEKQTHRAPGVLSFARWDGMGSCFLILAILSGVLGSFFFAVVVQACGFG
jgi:hypothetical protein